MKDRGRVLVVEFEDDVADTTVRDEWLSGTAQLRGIPCENAGQVRAIVSNHPGSGFENSQTGRRTSNLDEALGWFG